MVRCIPKTQHLTVHVQAVVPRVLLTPVREGIAYIGTRIKEKTLMVMTLNVQLNSPQMERGQVAHPDS
jgi:hypothetical protein